MITLFRKILQNKLDSRDDVLEEIKKLANENSEDDGNEEI
jgi:hypothetical protein